MSHQPPHVQILDLLCGSMKSQAIHACAKLGVADLVKDEPQSLDDLVQATGADRTNLYRLLRLLVALEVLGETEGRFQVTPLSRIIQSDGPLYYLALMVGEGWQWGVQEGAKGVSYSLHSGKPAISQIYGTDLWGYLKANSAEGTIFHRAMNNTVGMPDAPIAQALTSTYPLAGATLVDVGGGLGSFLIELLQQNPDLKGVLFDQPEVIQQAREYVGQAGLLDRCELVAGDFFEQVPAGGSYYFMRQIVKDWTDEDCARILDNCRQAMQPDGRILVAEQVLGPGTADAIGKLIDFLLMTALGGRERDKFEFEQLFAKAGFALLRSLPTNSAYTVLEISALRNAV